MTLLLGIALNDKDASSGDNGRFPTIGGTLCNSEEEVCVTFIKSMLHALFFLEEIGVLNVVYATFSASVVIAFLFVIASDMLRTRSLDLL